MDRKILFPLVLAALTVVAINYFNSGSGPKPGEVAPGQQQQQQQTASGQPIRVATFEDLNKPLKLDVEFEEKKIPEEQVVTVETDHATLKFSSHGAVLESIAFNDHLNKNGKPLRTIFDHGSMEDEQRKKGCFLVALDKKTPYFYRLTEKDEQPGFTAVTFKAETSEWVLSKTYKVFKDSYKIDVSLGFDTKSEKAQPIRPRLMFVAPHMSELKDDALSVVTYSESNDSLEKRDVKTDQGLAWYWNSTRPVFGAENKYFLHTLYSDTEKFVQRAYFKTYDEKTVQPILEGHAIEKKSAYNLSFYVGPKVFDHLGFVDSRLEEVMSFGWLSWLCKMLLKLLQWVHNYVGNYGYAIIVLTILIKLPFVPLSIHSRRKLEQYQKYQPTIAKIREKYKNNPQLQHQEFLKFHKDHNLSPATPMMGCLPQLIQLPILFGLYRVLNTYLDLYHAPFIGWITDLSVKDPYYIIPICMGLSMLWQQSLMPAGDSKSRVMFSFMALMMTVVFAGLPAGLVLYWFTSGLFGIFEDYLRRVVYRR